MGKTDVTKELENAIYRETKKQGTFGCLEVTIGFFGNERVDYMTYNTKGEWRCYEIKCSVSDFHSKAKKTFLGHYNYYVMTRELYDKVKDEIPSHIGVYVYGTLVKRPKKQELGIDEQILKDSFIRSLYRDVEKFYNNGNENLVGRLQNKINKLENEKRQQNNELMTLKNHLYFKFGRNWKDKIEFDD